MVKPRQNIFAVLVAAGSGSRFGSDIPKQFLPLDGVPVVIHAIRAFRVALPECKIILVLSAGAMDFWHEICRDNSFSSPEVVCGGSTRTESVANALAAINASGADTGSIVMIHDGARPLVSPELIISMKEAIDNGADAAVPATAPTDSLMTADGMPVDRSAFRAVQTPQAFRLGILTEAYTKLSQADTDFKPTDDASVVARFTDTKINLVAGQNTNIKITHPDDIKIAEILMQR